MQNTESILFLNCLGSYFNKIINEISDLGRKHTLLYYLAKGNLSYQKLVLDEVEKKYHSNAWGYQPIVIKDIQGQPLVVDEVFLRYIEERYNITIELLDMNNDRNLIAYLINTVKNEKRFGICNVDEFYVPESSQFYRKSHNKHFLLVKNANEKTSSFEIVDSEKNKSYQIAYSQLEKAVYCSQYRSKSLFLVDCNSYIDSINSRTVLEMFKQNPHTCEYLDGFIDEIDKMLNGVDTLNEYFYKGYYYTIQSKIIPYYYMLYYLLKENNIYVYRAIESVLNDWKFLNNFMRYKIEKQDFSKDSIMSKLEKIYKKEKEITIQFY